MDVHILSKLRVVMYNWKQGNKLGLYFQQGLEKTDSFEKRIIPNQIHFYYFI
jgi:hypothetical protein